MLVPLNLNLRFLLLSDYQSHILACQSINAFFLEPRVVLDLVFAIDGSDSLTDEQFDNLKKTVKRMIEDHTISRLDTHISVVEYSDEPTVVIYLNDTFNAEEINARIDRIVPSKGRNAIAHKALEEVADNIFSVSKGGRAGAAKAVVILTDGDSSSPTELEAVSKALKDSGARLYVVIVGDGKDKDGIVKVVSVPEDVFPVVDPSDVPKVGPDASKKVKNDVKKGE